MATKESDAEHNKMNVLLVDELAGIDSNIADILRAKGHIVLEASSQSSACNMIKSDLFRLQVIDLIVLALKPSVSSTFMYESAATLISRTIRAAGLGEPAFIFLPVTGESSQPMIQLAADFAAGIIPRRQVYALDEQVGNVRPPKLPTVFGYHTCADRHRCNGIVNEIYSEMPGKGAQQFPFADATAFYFDYVGQQVDWKRPQPAIDIVSGMLKIDFYREGLDAITKRAFITNWHRITKAQPNFPVDIELVHNQYEGKKTVYAIKCDYRVQHSWDK